jgi:hypothetical protein
MLFDPYYREGGDRIGILGSGKADQGYGFLIGVKFFTALGSRIWVSNWHPGQLQAPDNIDRHRRC